MFKKKIKNFVLVVLLSLFLFLLSSRVFAQMETPLFSFSLDFQNFFKNLFDKLMPTKDADTYKEKYYELLQELAKIKISLKGIQETQITQNFAKYLGKTYEVKILKTDPFGYIYTQLIPNATQDMLVLDKNYVLVGKVVEVTPRYLLIRSLNHPETRFSLASLDGNLLGLAQSISNGYLEVNYIDPQVKVETNDFVITYGDDVFPKNFLVGSISKIYSQPFNQKIIVKLLFDLEPGKLYLLSK